MKYSLTKHYKYKLEEMETCCTGIRGDGFENKYMYMHKDGSLWIRKGYAWDGSSIPHKKLIRVLSLWRYDGDRYCKIASLVHDALCQAMREGNIPKCEKIEADAIYWNLCLAGGLPRWRANKRFDALRKFGDCGIEPEKNPRNKIFLV